MPNKKIDSIIRKASTKEDTGPDGFTVTPTKHFKKNYTNLSQIISKNRRGGTTSQLILWGQFYLIQKQNK